MKRLTPHLDIVTKTMAGVAATLILGSGWTAASTLKSRPMGHDALLVEVVTDRPVVSAGEDLPAGYHRVSIADLSSMREPGAPALPFRTFLVGLPEGKTIALSAKSLGARRVGAFRLAPFVGEPPMGAERDLDEARRESLAFDPTALEEQEDPAVYGRAAPWPASLAVLHGTGILRDQPVAEVRVYPVQYSPLDFELVHHERIQIRVRFVDAGRAEADGSPRVERPSRLDPDPARGPEHLRVFDSILRRSVINYDMIARDRRERRASMTVSTVIAGVATSSGSVTGPQMLAGAPGAVKISVIQDGLYQVTPAMLTAAGVDVSMVDPGTFHMTAGGIDVPILVDGEGDGIFDPADRVIFFGTGIHNDRFTRTNVYYLAFNGAAGPRIGSRSGTFTGVASTPASFVTTAHAEQNLNYTARIRPGVTEAWYWKLQSRDFPGADALNYGITVDRIDTVPHTITVRARMLGLTTGNHTPRLLLNGTQIAQNTFSGEVMFTQSASVSSSLLLEGANTLTVDLQANGNGNDQIAFDYVEVDYKRTYAVDGDRLLFDGEGTGTFHIALSNLGSSDLVLMDVTATGSPQQITIPPAQITPGPPHVATFEDTLVSDRAYAVSTRAALRQPASVLFDFPSSLASPSNGADYIIITDRSLLSAMGPLATYRASQGLRTAIVATDDIYDEFNFGRSSPASIKSFLTYAYNNWTAPAPAYVLLAGDGHIDYTDNFGSGVPEVVPPSLLAFTGFGESPSDNDYVTVAGGDLIPEMFIGRLPIRSVSDATTMVNSILHYETAAPAGTLNQQSLFVADNNDPIFQAILENLQLFMPATMGAAQAYLPGGDPNDPPSTSQINATTDAVIAGFNDGSLVATYFGHGNVTVWAKEKILEHQPNPATGTTGRLDANRLTDTGRQSFLVSLNCINGYFVDLIPAGPGHSDYSLAEEWLRRSNRGAVAAWAPSALGSVSDYDSISYELYSHIFMDHMTTLGPTTIAALLDAVNLFGISTENLKGMIFFGDPATRLALDSDLDGLLDYREMALGSSVTDADTDDDGLSDGAEVVTLGTSPTSPDSDGDLVFDGTELGVTSPLPATDPNSGFFVPDADPATTTNPIAADTDGGGASDGFEDADRNGRIDPGETNPNNPADDPTCPGPVVEVDNLVVTRSGDDIVLTWDPASSVPCAMYRVLAAPDAPYPKSSLTPFTLVFDTGSPTFTHVGAAASATHYDYLVRIVHPQLGEGPLGAYGQ
ncbi:MAG TPA: C25 family cysteine peptidase [Candidatus Polarisedimenticolia bacterium]|jgi:hypothetical protein